MRLRHKTKGWEVQSDRFNLHGFGEIIVCGEDWMDSDFQRDYDVFVNGAWKDLNQAFRDRDVITNNYSTRFFEPPTPEDRERGYTL